MLGLAVDRGLSSAQICVLYAEGLQGVATIVQGAIVQGDFCPRGLLSKETFVQGMFVQGTFVQGDFCPRRFLSKGTIVQGDICPSRLLSKIVQGHFMSKDTFVQGDISACVHIGACTSILKLPYRRIG